MLSFARVGKRWSAAAAVGLLLAISAGCGEEAKPPPLPPGEVLDKASDAIQVPSSFHFALETAKADQLKRQPGLWLLEAEGDAVKPDKMVGSVTALWNGVTLTSQVVVVGEGQYWTDPLSRVWSRMPDYFKISQFFDPARGIADILAGLKDPTMDGSETVEGASSYRLKGSVSPEALRALSPEVNTKDDLATTIWVGASDFLLRKVLLQGPLVEGEPAEVERTIVISDYGKEVKVETPVVE